MSCLTLGVMQATNSFQAMYGVLPNPLRISPKVSNISGGLAFHKSYFQCLNKVVPTIRATSIKAHTMLQVPTWSPPQFLVCFDQILLSKFVLFSQHSSTLSQTSVSVVLCFNNFYKMLWEHHVQY